MVICSTIDECRDRLHRTGWSIGETAGVRLWLLSGNNGESVIHAEGQSQAEAWYRATLQAEAVGPDATLDQQRADVFLELLVGEGRGEE